MKIKSFNNFINENFDNKIFLGYHSSDKDIVSGYYKSTILNRQKYSNLIRDVYMEIISDYDENLENDDIDGMNNKFEELGYGFTFVSNNVITSSAYQTSKYKYGDFLYKVYGNGNEAILDDVNEIGANIVVSKKPLYFEKIDEDITNIILSTIKEMKMSTKEINDGSCDDFAFRVKKKLKDVEVLSTEDFIELCEDGIDAKYSVYEYSKKAPKNFKFGQIGHFFLYYQGNFYDSELIYGSTDMFDIPTLQVAIEIGNYKNKI
jgi:hypothetical protein